MLDFVESLESRRLLSTVTLAMAEANLASDAKTLVTDAGTARTAVIDGVKAFKADLQSLDLKNGSLKNALQKDVTSGRSKLRADISHIITVGLKDGLNVVFDVLHITLFDAGNPAKVAEYQKRLAADVKTLQTLETPLVEKLVNDVAIAITQINGAVQAIVTAGSADQALATDWTTLSTAFQSAQQTLVPDLTNVLSDLDALSAAT